MALDDTILLFNTLTRKKEKLIPIKRKTVSIYSCGPTVYSRIHLGNFRRYFLDDILVRSLVLRGLSTNFVQNITDVGHLTDDADSGLDKVEESAKSRGVTAKDIVDKFTELYITDSKLLNITKADYMPYASEHIKEQIEFISLLEKNGFTYKTDDGVYFDTSNLSDYGKLIRLKKDGLIEGKRVEINRQKKNLTDFALWKFSPKGDIRQMEWKSPWGIGFPGWHIECSAMSKKYLRFPFDIHTGGIDNAPTHNTNEIAQNEALTKTDSVNIWMHSEHMLVDGEKMSKSLGNIYTTDDLERFHIHPLSFRYFALNTHYRKRLDFTWDGLKQAQDSYFNLIEEIARIKTLNKDINILKKIFIKNKIDIETINNVKLAIFNDLNTPIVLALVQKLISNENIKNEIKLSTLEKIDSVLGLELISKANLLKNVPNNVLEIGNMRKKARDDKNWGKADSLRDEIVDKGFILEDAKDTYRIIRKMTYKL